MNTCFINRNVFPNGVNSFVENGFKNSIFRQKAQNFVHFGQYSLVQISLACGPGTYQTMYGETSDFQCQHLQRWHGKVLMAMFLQKLIFRPNLSCYHYWCWHRKSKISPYTIWYVFGPHAGEIWTNSYDKKCTKF